MNPRVAALRLHHQRLTRPLEGSPARVVQWLGAVQAQEYGPARWALALRSARTLDAEIARAFDRGRILRTHVMRPTWHFVAPADIRWMLELTAPRVQQRMAPYNRLLELDTALMNRAARVVERALDGQRHLTRQELRAELQRAGLVMSGQRLAHVVMHAELEAVICSGPRRGNEFTYALVAERAPRAGRLERDEALGQLAKRFFRSHGPATVRDFVWWSGLTTADARRGLEINRARAWEDEGVTYWRLPGLQASPAAAPAAILLPIYDEYIVAYRDRRAVSHPPVSGGGAGSDAVIFRHTLITGGQIAGTWNAAARGGAVSVTVTPLRRLTGTEAEAIEHEAARYARFLGLPVHLTIARPSLR